jgi:hypothetical protein
MKHTLRQISGGLFTVYRGFPPHLAAIDKLTLTVDLYWHWNEGEPGSNSIGKGWTLDRIEAYDEFGDDVELTEAEEQEAIEQYKLT